MTWEITISFGGFYGAENDYRVEADTQDEAEQLALEEACNDICIMKAKKISEVNGNEYYKQSVAAD